jgi:cell division protease FtsH
MVTQYGMTERIGAIKLGSENAEPFLGRDMGHSRDYSEEVAGVVDEEVKRLIEAAHDEAWQILVDNRDILDELVLELLEKETLDKAQVAGIFTHIRRRPSRPAWTGSAKRSPQAGPVMTPKELASPNGSNGQDKEHSMGAPGPTDVPDSPLPSDEIPGRPLGFEG